MVRGIMYLDEPVFRQTFPSHVTPTQVDPVSLGKPKESRQEHGRWSRERRRNIHRRLNT